MEKRVVVVGGKAEILKPKFKSEVEKKIEDWGVIINEGSGKIPLMMRRGVNAAD